jgi:hypothetical protein
MSDYTPEYAHTSWLSRGVQIPELREAIARAAEVVRYLDFDAFAARGVSGLLFLTPFALAMNKSIIVVRKDNDDTHSRRTIEGDRAVRRYVIVDEFMGTGRTVYAILKAIRYWAPQAECLGVLEVNGLFERLPIPCEGAPYARRDNRLTEIFMDAMTRFGPLPDRKPAAPVAPEPPTIVKAACLTRAKR